MIVDCGLLMFRTSFHFIFVCRYWYNTVTQVSQWATPAEVKVLFSQYFNMCVTDSFFLILLLPVVGSCTSKYEPEWCTGTDGGCRRGEFQSMFLKHTTVSVLTFVHAPWRYTFLSYGSNCFLPYSWLVNEQIWIWLVNEQIWIWIYQHQWRTM